MALEPHRIFTHLINKILEWQEQDPKAKGYVNLAEAEQAFKDWLWGTSHG